MEEPTTVKPEAKKPPRLYTEEERAKAVEDYRSSGVSAWNFAQQTGINYWGLKRWVVEMGRGAAKPKSRLVPVRVKGSSMEEGRIEIMLICGTVVKVPVGIGAGRIGEIVAAVRKSAC